MRQLLGLGCPASKKIGDVSDGVNRAGVLHPCGSDDGNSSQMLRTSAGGGGDQNQVAHLRNAFFQTYDHANRRLLAIDVGVEQIDDALLLFEGKKYLSQMPLVGFGGHEVGTGATLVTTSLASNALARLAARSSARRDGSVSS